LEAKAQLRQRMQKDLPAMADSKNNGCIDALLRRVTDPGRVIDDLIPWHRDPGIGKAATLLDRTLEGDDEYARIQAAELLLLPRFSTALNSAMGGTNAANVVPQYIVILNWSTKAIHDIAAELNP
jgi:hypothetical protein